MQVPHSLPVYPLQILGAEMGESRMPPVVHHRRVGAVLHPPLELHTCHIIVILADVSGVDAAFLQEVADMLAEGVAAHTGDVGHAVAQPRHPDGEIHLRPADQAGEARYIFQRACLICH